MNARDLLAQTTRYNDTLNPVAWQGTSLRPEIRAHLLKVAKQFVEYLEIPNFQVLDIVLTGSNANYNWNRFSDFDLHVVTDYDSLRCPDIAENFYNAKKKIWNDAHDIMIQDHEIELYIEDDDNPPHSGGMYSLMNDEWIKEPQHDEPEIDGRAIQLKVKSMLNLIRKSMEHAESADDLKMVLKRLRDMRKAGLESGGEFGVENLTFKTLRNMGAIDMIAKAALKLQDRDLTL
jgi:predicted nucleotidyltransferase